MDALEVVRTTRLDGLGVNERARAVQAFARLEARLAALEKVAQWAGATVSEWLPAQAQHPGWKLKQALAELKELD